MKHIHIKNKTLLDKKIQEIKAQGLNHFHVVTDFDRTLTKCFIDGKKIPSTIALIREGGYLTEDYPKKAFALFDKYHPIELDDSLDYDYKFNKMKEWWEAHEQLLVDSGMNKQVISDILVRYPKRFRRGTLNFLDTLSSSQIPLLIFSSGIGNLIEGYLLKENRLTPNIHILSNTFEFDEKGNAKGYKNGVIHIMNKSETKIENKEYLDLISGRNNALLLGDSIEDLGMINDLETRTVVTIGFLNELVDKRLESYMNTFDIVITDDGTMDYVNDVLKELFD